MPLTEENKNIVEVSSRTEVSAKLAVEEEVMEVDVTLENNENKIQVSVQMSDVKETEEEEDEDPNVTEEGKNLSTIQEHAENDSGTIEETEKFHDGEEMENDDNSMGSFEQVHAEEQDIEDFLDAQEDSVCSGELYDDTLLADADGVITFSMTLEKRLRELSDVFEHFAQGGLSLKNFWALYAECYVEPAGWTALYRPKTTDLNCSTTSSNRGEYETVEVEQVNFSTLDVRVKKVQEGEKIQNEQELKEDSNEHCTPEKDEKDKEEEGQQQQQEKDEGIFFVPLLDLYPLAKQENGALNMKLTAKCIDNYRFFEQHLFLPWDDDTEAERWYLKNLETRIQLYYDLQSGIISETMSKEIYGLIQEAKENQIKISKLEDQLDFHDSDTDIDEHIVMQVFPLHTRQEEIQIRLQQLQNPFFRNMLTTMNLIKKRRSLRTQERVILIAQKSFTCQELVSDLEFIKSQIDENEKIRIVNTLQEALEICEKGVKIFVTTGIHHISGLCNLEEGGQIIGIPSSPGNEKEKVVIETRDAGDCFLSINTDSTVQLENVFIRIGAKYTAPVHTDNNDSSYLEQQPASYLGFLVSKGTLKLNNVSLEGFTESGVGCDEIETNGMKVLSEGSLSMSNCNIHQFNKGIVARCGSLVEMNSSVVENCLIGVESSSETNFKLTGVTIKKCLKFGMLVKWKDDDVETTIGGVETLQTLPKTTAESTIINDCIAGQVCFCSEGNLSMRNASLNESHNI